MKVLFMCTANSCRSVLSEGLFNHLAPSGWHALSAGQTGRLRAYGGSRPTTRAPNSSSARI